MQETPGSKSQKLIGHYAAVCSESGWGDWVPVELPHAVQTETLVAVSHKSTDLTSLLDCSSLRRLLTAISLDEGLTPHPPIGSANRVNLSVPPYFILKSFCSISDFVAFLLANYPVYYCHSSCLVLENKIFLIADR
ncbi:hypothetical protein DSO57_1010768 [Entomophthora muscae]|uniref:Uncharacterized protein n=1 Tax=Entomophthora muscae TaxID=34485 RepID=A0ACC2UFW2_9FUNG|nr:hypothetical protein DSO57_1010768 [Entomophthora muscae]